MCVCVWVCFVRVCLCVCGGGSPCCSTILPAVLEPVGIVAIGNHRSQPNKRQMAGVHTWNNQTANEASKGSTETVIRKQRMLIVIIN